MKSATTQPLVASVVEIDRVAGRVWSADEIALPSAVDIDSGGRRLVADRERHRVLLFPADAGAPVSMPIGSPMDADFLPGGGFLVTSARDRSVVEWNEEGEVVWRYDGLTGPLDADRLANGDTLIADSRPARILQVDRAGNVVWEIADGIKLPYDVEMDAAGNVLVADYNGHHVRCIRRDGTTCWRANDIGHPSSLQLLDDGSMLVSTHKAGSIVWLTADGRILGNWAIGARLEDFAVTGRERIVLAQRLPANVGVDEEQVADLLATISREPREPRAAAAPRPVAAVDGVDTRHKNLVLILFDSLRLDHLPWHGYWRSTAPALQRMARRGLVFDQYVTQAPWTKPSVASLFTSTYASVHGVTKQTPESQVPGSLVTMAEALAAAGYYTAAAMENPHMGDRHSNKGFDQGFARYDYVPAKRGGNSLPGRMTRAAIKVLEDRPADRPFFLMVFFLNPHYPYDPGRKIYGDMDAGPSNSGPINDYDGEIREADQAVARLLHFLQQAGVADDTIVVFSSDHGEEFGDHGARFHGDTLYDCVLHVPLVITGLDRVGRFPGLVREIDVLPTLLDYLGVEATPQLAGQMAGISVRPFLEPGVQRTGLVAYSESQFRKNVHLVSERSESRKVVADLRTGSLLIFDLANDPQEYDDLATEAEKRRELERLRSWEESFEPAQSEAVPSGAVPAEVLERLRAAGYLTDTKP